MWGATVIELKSDLRRELPDVLLARMPDYLADAASRTRSTRPVIGIATDGATSSPFNRVDGVLTEIRRHTNPERPDELMAWLEPCSPTGRPAAGTAAVAQASAATAYFRLRAARPEALWAVPTDDPECASSATLGRPAARSLRRRCWRRFAVPAAHLPYHRRQDHRRPRAGPSRFRSGAAALRPALADEGIFGAVEADFFDWPLNGPRAPTGSTGRQRNRSVQPPRR